MWNSSNNQKSSGFLSLTNTNNCTESFYIIQSILVIQNDRDDPLTIIGNPCEWYNLEIGNRYSGHEKKTNQYRFYPDCMYSNRRTSTESSFYCFISATTSADARIFVLHEHFFIELFHVLSRIVILLTLQSAWVLANQQEDLIRKSIAYK